MKHKDVWEDSWFILIRVILAVVIICLCVGFWKTAFADNHCIKMEKKCVYDFDIVRIIDGDTVVFKADFLSNGVKIRSTNGSDWNGSGAEFVYLAFAKSPFALNNRAI